MYKKESNQDQNFWISYADLMAGLLFVFILVVGAIVIKYVFIEKDLKKKESDLQKSKEALFSTSDKLSQKSRALKELKNRIKTLKTTLNQKDKKIGDVKSSLKLQTKEIEKLKALLLEYDLNSTKMEQNLTDIKQKLAKDENILILKDSEIEALSHKLMEQEKAHQALVEELNITKAKIKSLSGIRIKVVDKLRDALGESIKIDPKSGAIRFSSSILFNKGEYKLKPESKKELQKSISKYINTLLKNKDIREYIDGITIEGHTDTDGSYLYNLALSQKRALEVLKYIYESDPKNIELYKKYLSASGRSYSDLIVDSNGKEDKDASRRIEVKFRLKNEKAIKELENFLNK